MNISLEAQFMENLPDEQELPEFHKNNEPQMNTDERRFNDRVTTFIRALNPVFAPSASFAVRLEHAPQRARRTKGISNKWILSARCRREA